MCRLVEIAFPLTTKRSVVTSNPREYEHSVVAEPARSALIDMFCALNMQWTQTIQLVFVVFVARLIRLRTLLQLRIAPIASRSTEDAVVYHNVKAVLDASTLLGRSPQLDVCGFLFERLYLHPLVALSLRNLMELPLRGLTLARMDLWIRSPVGPASFWLSSTRMGCLQRGGCL